jgi:pimeloyl-ACP methyl ester carboxylesterase
MPAISANGTRFHVQQLPPALRDGDPTVVFVHGLVIDNLASFYYTLAGPVVAAGARAVLYDLRGHGKSGRPPRGYTTRDGVADLCALLDALDVTGPVYLVGNSYGGLIAARLAVAEPQRVAGLVLIEAICAGPRAAAWIEDMVNTMSAGALSLEFERTASRYRDAGPRKMARLATTADALLNGTSLIDDLATERLLGPAELAALRCPVLGVYGAQSELLDGASDLRRHVRDCRVEVLDGLAHTVLRDASAQVRDIVLGWLPLGIAAHHARAGEALSGGVPPAGTA